jgi:peptide/nickel transport system ATP-binding protein
MLLEVENLRTEFQTSAGRICAVDGVSFSVDTGKTLCIVGESGCGKSVTALSLLALLPFPPAEITGGSVRLEGRELIGLAADEMRKVRGGQMAIIFQEPMTSLNPVRSVGKQISEAIRAHFPKMPRDEIKNRVISLIKSVGIGEPEKRYHFYPHQMSGGMRQRIMIAIALSCRPKVLIADEPTTALDVTIQAQILSLINELQDRLGMAVILVTHDLGVVSETADEVVVMYAGQVVERAATEIIFSRPRHPYTKGLLASIPRFGATDKNTRLEGIAGMVPSLSELPVGCRFQSRCGWVQNRCREIMPELSIKEGDAGGHLVRCFEA